MMTYQEAMDLIEEHTDYGGSVDRHALAIAISPHEPYEADPLCLEQLQQLRVVREELGRTIADPMWNGHAEVSKRALKRWHEAIDIFIKGVTK
jgi:hypothetical protein